MKRGEEVAIMLSALSAAGITQNESVRCAVDCGLKMIRVKKFAERHDRDSKERLEPAVSAVIQHKKETKA
jgi:hypothetical protein